MTLTVAVFAGLVVDEYGKPVETAYVGDEAMYVVNDQGFRRHIPAGQVDRAVLAEFAKSIEGNEDILSKEMAKMVGAEDIFSQAMIENQFKNLEQQFEELMQVGLPEEARAYLGMAGFKIRINFHGEVLEVIQPGMIAPEE